MFDIAKPNQTVLVTCRGNADVMGKTMQKDNIITIDWHMPVSFNPPMYAVAIAHSRFSHKLISNSKVFCVNFMSMEEKKQVIFCGTHTGMTNDKFADTKLKKVESQTIDCPWIKEALGHMELEVVHEYDAGDHTIFVGQIKHKKLHHHGQRILHLGKLEFTSTEW